MRLLIPLPDRDFDVTEVSVPWHVARAAGVEVTFATEHGDKAAADPLLLTGVVFGQLGAEPHAKSLYRKLENDPAFEKPIRYGDVEPDAFDGLLLPGGHAKGMRQYLESRALREKVLAYWRLRRPVAAICHGVIVLARTTDRDSGRSVLFDRRTTCLPKYMERVAWLSTRWKVGDYYRTYPEYVEDEVTRALAHPEQFVRGPIHLFSKGTETNDSAAFTVDDGYYISARWPGDAYKLGRLLVEKMTARKEGRTPAASQRGALAPPPKG